MLRCVATNTLFMPKHYTLTSHGRQTTGPFHTSCISHRGHRLSWFSLSYTAWLEVAAHIVPLSKLSCASVPPTIHPARALTVKFFFLPTNRHQLPLPFLFFSILKALTLYCFLCPHSTPAALITSPCSVVPDESRHLSSGFIPSSLANLCAPPIKECRPILRAFSLNCLTRSSDLSELVLPFDRLKSPSSNSPWEIEQVTSSQWVFPTVLYHDLP